MAIFLLCTTLHSPVRNRVVDMSSMHSSVPVAATVASEMAWIVYLCFTCMITAFKTSVEHLGRMAEEILMWGGCVVSWPVFVLFSMAVMVRGKARSIR